MALSPSSRYPQLHEIDVQEFLPFASKHLKWGDFSRDIVIDVGCGFGINSTKHIATLFPNFQKMVAIDLVPNTIDLAKMNYPHRKIEYCVANIEDSSTLTKWMGKISKVISVNCFTFLKDQAAAFRNVYELLTSGGEAAILFCLQSSYYDTFGDIMEQARWKEHLKNIIAVVPESHTKKFDVPHYLMILKEVGFQVVLCQDEEKTYVYQSESACRKFVTDCSLTDHVPRDQREEFKQAIFETFLKHNPNGCGEQPRLNYRVLLVLVKKLETWL